MANRVNPDRRLIGALAPVTDLAIARRGRLASIGGSTGRRGEMATIDARLPHLAPSLAELGQPGSRYRVATPALVLDLDALDRNIARMATRAKRAGLKLRPHAKSHKSAFIAKRQIAAGAAGVCCAKLGEAEALAEAGIDGILITSPLAGAAT